MKSNSLQCSHLLSCLLLGLWSPLYAQVGGSAPELADFTLEELSTIQITAVSRRSEPLSAAAGSVYVITANDIRRSGARSLPEALRLAPNLHVARADTNQYAISARGFNSVTANKMLIMIDGRTVYSPLFSGVFWEAQDVMLEDVERIEVMSGAGGTAWGSNAVNGIINVITRPARATQGVLASVGAGNRDREAAMRYGAQTSHGVSYRLYARTITNTTSRSAEGAALRDASVRTQAGFRADWGQPADSVTLQGDIYGGAIDQGAVLARREISGLNLLARMTRQLSDGSSLRVQAFYDHTGRDQPGSVRDRLNTIDVEFQQDFARKGNNTLLWGGGARYQRDKLDNVGPTLAFYPPNRSLNLVNLFARNDHALRRDLDLTLGLKLENNHYTGLEYLPNARLAWQLAPGQLLWAAASRTVRIPSRLDRELFLPAQPPFLTLAGGPSFVSEVARVYELGYRAQPNASLSYSLTLFHHDFDRLRSVEPSPIGPQFENRIRGRETGVEAWGKYTVAEGWRITAGLVKQKLRLRLKPGSAAIGGVATLGDDPNMFVSLGTSFELGRGIEFDLLLRRVGGLPSPAVPAYSTLDARFGWQLRRDLEFSLTAQNLVGARHAEWGAAPLRAVYDRAVFVKMVWRL